jgi:DNA-binding MarR family transcriptional regulator
MAFEAKEQDGGGVVSLSRLREAPPPALPDESRVDAWRSLFRTHMALTGRIERALSEEGLPPIGWFDVLWALHRSPRGRMRPRALVLEVAVSKSGLTRLLDRLCDAGLTERVSLADDRRGHEIVLTEAGARTLRQMWPVYASELERHFGPLSEAEGEMLHGLLARVEGSACASEDPDCDTG